MIKSRLVFFTFYFLLLTLFLSSCVEWARDPFSSPPDSPEKYEEDRTDSIRIKVATFNVGSGKEATPVRIAKIFFPFRFDVICFTEVPEGNWIDRVGQMLDMNYYYTGRISSANKKDKYKTILSRYPITNTNEFMLNSKGWFPASIIRGEIEKNSNKFSIFCLQIAGSQGEKGSYAYMVSSDLIRRSEGLRVIVAGDFDNKPDDNAMKIFDREQMNNIWTDLNVDFANEYTCCLNDNTNKGIVDHILYSRISRSHTIRGGVIDMNINLSNHKPVWAELEFPPPRLKKKKRF